MYLLVVTEMDSADISNLKIIIIISYTFQFLVISVLYRKE